MPNKPDYHLLDVTALRQLLAERVEDWGTGKKQWLTTIIQAAIHTAYNHMEEWHDQAYRIHARKVATNQKNAAYARTIKKEKTK